MIMTSSTPEVETPVRVTRPTTQGLNDALAIMKLANGEELNLIPGFIPRVVVARETYSINDWDVWSSAKVEAEVVAGLNEDARAELDAKGSVTFLHRINDDAIWVSITKIESFISAMFRKATDLTAPKLGGMPF